MSVADRQPATAAGVEGERVHSDEVLGRARPVAWWGTLLALAAATTMLTTLGFSHVYLGALDGLRPELGRPAVALLPLLASSAAMAFARLRARNRRDARGAVPALAVAAVLGLVFLGLQAQSYAEMQLDVQTDVAEASFAVNVGFHHALAVTGLVALLVAALRRAAYPLSVRSRDVVLVAGLVWQTVVLTWVPMFALLYLAPRLT